jgi:DUF4097 and DUF4098 domain-containing protein YvlB
MKRIIAIMLSAIFALGLFGCACSTPIVYGDADKYTAGNFTYDGSGVTKIDVDWAAGDITLKNGSGTLSVTENSADTLEDWETLRWWIDGTTLKIRYCQSGKAFRFTDGRKKDLTVEFPTFADVSIDVASGKVVSEGRLDVGKFDLDTAYGGAEIAELYAEEVDIDSASGRISVGYAEVKGTFQVDTASGGLSVGEIDAHSIQIDSASGGVSLGLKRTIWKVDLDVASGAVDLKLLDPEEGATLQLEAITGSLNTKLPYEKSGKTYTFGNGKIRINIDAVAGTVTVE